VIANAALRLRRASRDRWHECHWRNARTLSLHNPLIYKERIIGDYAVNDTAPPLTRYVEKQLAAE
jgi:hypothetical protein